MRRGVRQTTIAYYMVKCHSNIETKVKEAIDWIQQQNTQIESSLGIF